MSEIESVNEELSCISYISNILCGSVIFHVCLMFETKSETKKDIFLSNNGIYKNFGIYSINKKFSFYN